MSFHFLAARAVRGKEKKRGKNTVSRNRSKECKLTAMKSVRRDEESVPPHTLTTLGRECGRECGSHPKQPALDFRPPLTAFELDIWKGEGHLFV